MNLITETKKKLAYQEANLIDLQECVEQPVTKDCIHYLKEQLEATEKRIEYYSAVLEILERRSVKTMRIDGWAFKENETELRDERYARYKELNKDGITIESTNTGYAQKTYRGKVNNEELSELDILLICDSGNTCFGGVISKGNGTFEATVYTD